jgi:predicted ATPase
MSSMSWFHRGDFAAARAYAGQALAVYDPAHARNLASQAADQQIVALTLSFRSLASLGLLDQARLRRDQTLEQARQRGHAFTLAIVLSHALIGDYEIADPTVSLERANELAALCAEHGFPFWGVIASWHRGRSLSALRRLEEALPLLTEALAGYRAIGAVAGVPNLLTSLGDALGKAGRPTEGLKQLDEAARQIETTDERWIESNMHRVRGELLIAVGDLAAAESSIRQAITVARRQNAKFWELRATLDLARLWRDQGKRDEARDLLAPIYGWFTEGFDTPVLQEAKSLLEQLN